MKFKLTALPLLLIAVTLIFQNHANAQSQKAEKSKIVHKTEISFLSWFPESYYKNKKEKYPLLIFLHGSGERGNDLNKVKAWGPPAFVESRPDFPFIVISPQCPDGQWWNVADLDQMLSKLLKKYRIDPDRVYLTGLSMGGFGSWEWACTYPNRFAAIAPVCGGGDIQMADEITKVAVWAFHGQDDPVVPVKRTIEMVEAVNAAGGNAKMSIYPGVGHDSWRAAYADEELYKWLLEHKRK